MSDADDIARIKEQERRLVFDAFDEAAAFDIGQEIRARGLARAMPIVVEVRLWDRLLFYAALPGSTANNTEWVRRKLNVVRMFHGSTYRLGLEQPSPDRLLKPDFGLNPADYVLAGGGFPLTLRGAGVIGAFGVSGLPQRQDHELIVEVLCDRLGLPHAELKLAQP